MIDYSSKISVGALAENAKAAQLSGILPVTVIFVATIYWRLRLVFERKSCLAALRGMSAGEVNFSLKIADIQLYTSVMILTE